MSKETKIGLAVIGTLLVLFSAVLVRKLTRPAAAPAVAQGPVEAPLQDEAEATADASRQPSLGRTWIRAAAPDEAEPAPPEPAAQAEAAGADAPTGADARWAGPEYSDRAATATGGEDSGGEVAVAEEAVTTRAAAADPFQARAVEAETPGARPQNRSELLPIEGAAGGETVPVAAEDQPAAEDRPAAEEELLQAEVARSEEAEAGEVVRASGSDDAPLAAGNNRGAPRLSRVPAEPAGIEPAEEFDRRRGAGQLVAGGEYTVEPNDNFWTISEKVYGTGGYFKALREHNKSRLDDPDELHVGDKVLTPPAEMLAKRYPSLSPKQRRGAPAGRSSDVQLSSHRQAGGRTYVVSEGDTLFDIARYELGKAARWAEIYELNREVLGGDYDYLKPGIELALPTDGIEADAVTRRPGGARDR
jgi:nucleoid-associated protein YgaU